MSDKPSLVVPDAMFPQYDRLEIVRGRNGLILTTVQDGSCKAVLLTREGAAALARELVAFLKTSEPAAKVNA